MYKKEEEEEKKKKKPRKFQVCKWSSLSSQHLLEKSLKMRAGRKEHPQKPLFDINYTMFLPVQTNNYASLTIGNKLSKKGSVSKHPFVLKNFEQANLS